MQITIRHRGPEEMPPDEQAIRARVVAAFDRFDDDVQDIELVIGDDGPLPDARLLARFLHGERAVAHGRASDPVAAAHRAAQRAARSRAVCEGAGAADPSAPTD